MKKLFSITAIVLLTWLSLCAACATCNAQSGIWCWTTWRESAPVSVLSNPSITGISNAYYWSDLNPAPGKYNWARVDADLNAALKYGKHAAISVAAASKTPEWVKSKTQCLYFREYRKDGDGKAYEVILPVPYDSIYIKEWTTFIAELGKHVAANAKWNTVLTHVSLSGVGATTCEWRLPQMVPTREQPDVTNATELWRAAGYSGDKIIKCFDTFRKAWRTAFPSKALVIDIMNDNEFPLGIDTINVNEGIFANCLATNKPERYIFKATSLTNNSKGTLIIYMQKLGLRTCWQTNQSIYGAAPCNPCNNTSMTDALNIGISLKVDYIEMQTQAILNYPLPAKNAAIKYQAID